MDGLRIRAPSEAAGVARVPADLLLPLRGLVLNLPLDRRVIDRDAAFRHHLLELAVADGVFAVPAHALQDDEGMEAAELEGVHSGVRGQIVAAPLYLYPDARQCNRTISADQWHRGAIPAGPESVRVDAGAAVAA